MKRFCKGALAAALTLIFFCAGCKSGDAASSHGSSGAERNANTGYDADTGGHVDENGDHPGGLSPDSAADDAAHDVKDAADDVANAAKDAAHGAKNVITGAADDVKDAAQDAARGAKDAADDLTGH